MELHKALVRYRIVYLLITAFFLWLGWDAWEWFKANHSELKEWAVAGFVSIYAAVIAALKYSLENSRQNNEHD